MILLIGALQLCFINAESHDRDRVAVSIQQTMKNKDWLEKNIKQSDVQFIDCQADEKEIFIKIKQAEQNIERLKHEKRMNDHAMAMSTFVTIGATGFALAGICEVFKLFCLQGQPAAPAA